MAFEPKEGAFFYGIYKFLCDWLPFRKVLDFFRVKKVSARPLDHKLEIGLQSANKLQKDIDEEQGIRISGTSEGSPEHGKFENRQQSVCRKLIELPEDKIEIVISEGARVSRPVDVKHVESHKIHLLIESNYPPSTFRLHGLMECDKDFIDHEAESCSFMSLDDLIQICMPSSPVAVQPNGCLKSLKNIVRDIKLVAENGHPSPLLLKLFRAILSGVGKLHDELRIIHGQLNPQSILIGLEGSFSKLKPGLSTLGAANSDWLASTQHKSRGHETWEKDMYDLGRIFYYCITGRMPSKRGGLSMVDCPEVLHLISQLLNQNSRARSKAIELLQHPLFWNSEKRLSFLRDTRERVGDPQYSSLAKELQKIAVHEVQDGESWKEKVDDKIISHMNSRLKPKQKNDCSKNKQRNKYDYCSVLDLMRFIRNMMVHYGQLPKSIQRSVGTLHQGFDSYFTSRFPKLLIEVYNVVCKCCEKDKYFGRYFNDDGIL